MDRLALVALNSAMDDYASVTSVREELAAFFGKVVSDESLFSAFRELEVQGLVEAHRVSPDNQRLVPTSSTEKDAPDEIWFLAKAKGRQVVALEWGRVFQ